MEIILITRDNKVQYHDNNETKQVLFRIDCMAELQENDNDLVLIFLTKN